MHRGEGAQVADLILDDERPSEPRSLFVHLVFASLQAVRSVEGTTKKRNYGSKTAGDSERDHHRQTDSLCVELTRVGLPAKAYTDDRRHSPACGQ